MLPPASRAGTGSPRAVVRTTRRGLADGRPSSDCDRSVERNRTGDRAGAGPRGACDDARRAPAGEAGRGRGRARGRGLRRAGDRRKRLRGGRHPESRLGSSGALRTLGRARQQRRRRHRGTRRGDRHQAPGPAARHQPALHPAVLPRIGGDAESRRRRAPQRACRQHRLDRRQARRGLELGVLGHQAWCCRLDGVDEPRAERRGHQVRPRCAPPLWIRR